MSGPILSQATLVHSLSEPIIGKGLDGIIRSWNAGAEKLYGYSSSEAIGEPIAMLAPPDRLDELAMIMERLRRGAEIEHLETVRRHKDGHEIRISLTVTPIRDVSGEIVGAIAIAHDISERSRREEMQRLLADAGRLLVAGLDYREMLQSVAQVTVPGLADWCIVEMSGEAEALTELVVAHRDAQKVELVRRMRRAYPPTADRPNIQLRVLTTGTAELIPDVSEALMDDIAQNAEHRGMLRELSPRSMMVVPLRVGARTLGTILLAITDSRRRFGPDDLEVAEDLGRRAALAIENATLYGAEQEARLSAERAIEQTELLQSLAAEIAESLTPAEVAEVAVRHGIASLHADAGALQLLTDDGTTLQLVEGAGPERALVGGVWRRFPVDLNVPSADALRRLEPIFLESENDMRALYPQAQEPPQMPEGIRARAGAHVPLVAAGRPLGVLFFGFRRPRRFTEDERSFVLALGRQCAQALERAQLYESELQQRSKLSSLLERLHEGVISVDQNSRVEFASSAALRMLADVPLRQGGPMPETWSRFPLGRFVAGLFQTDVGVVETQVVSAHGDRVFDITGIPARGSDTALVILHDASERERRRRVEREFVDNAAHELRTPLASITSAIERLQGGAREIPEKRDRFLGHIQRESVRLNRLASSLLVLARAQARDEQPRREDVLLRRLIEEVVAGIEPRGTVEIVLDCPPSIVAHSNRDLLEHVLVNLIENAVAHTQDGSVRISASGGGGVPLAIEVSDTGSGIPAAELDRVFNRFYRGSSLSEHAGFGLGLAIAKEAVQAMGGSLELSSVLGEGTTARISLPAIEVPVPA